MSSPVRRLIGVSRGTPYPTVDDLKGLLGIDEADTSKDAAIAAMLESSLAMIEAYCGRYFMLDDYEEHFLPIDARNPYLLLSAYPVESVASVTRDDGLEGEPHIMTFGGWKLFPAQGILRQFQHGCCWCCRGHECIDADTVVDYRGGFPPDAWPADLVDILTRLFFDRWNATGGTGSVANYTGGGTGAIKSATVDGMRLDYDVGLGASKAAVDVPPDLWPYAAALARYRALDRAVWGV